MRAHPHTTPAQAARPHSGRSRLSSFYFFPATPWWVPSRESRATDTASGTVGSSWGGVTPYAQQILSSPRTFVPFCWSITLRSAAPASGADPMGKKGSVLLLHDILTSNSSHMLSPKQPCPCLVRMGCPTCHFSALQPWTSSASPQLREHLKTIPPGGLWTPKQPPRMSQRCHLLVIVHLQPKPPAAEASST